MERKRYKALPVYIKYELDGMIDAFLEGEEFFDEEGFLDRMKILETDGYDVRGWRDVYSAIKRSR